MSEKALNEKDIMNEVKEFESQFRDPNKQGLLNNNLTPEAILNKLGFRRVGYEDLDKSLKEGLEKPDAKTFASNPLGNNHNLNTNVVIMRNADGSVIYFFQGSFGGYTISRAKKTDGAYLIHELVHEFDAELGISEILDSISYYEIKQFRIPKHFATYEGLDIRIPLPEISNAEETRNQIRSI